MMEGQRYHMDALAGQIKGAKLIILDVIFRHAKHQENLIKCPNFQSCTFHPSS